MAIRFSPRLAILLVFLHSISAVVVHVTAMPLPVRLALLMLILLSLSYYLARDVFLLMPDSWCGISPDQEGVAIVTRDGSKFFGQFLNETTVSAFAVVLHVKPEGRRLPVSRIIFPDTLGANAFRELCVRLKFA